MAAKMLQLQQRKLILAGGLIACAVLGLVIWLIIMPAWGNWREETKLAGEMEKELASSWRLIRSRSEVKDKLNSTISDIVENTRYIPLPTLGNYRLGMEEYIRNCGNGLDLSLEDVFDQGTLKLKGGNNLFDIYQVRVSVKATYQDLSKFLRRVEKNNPMVSLSSLTIHVSRDDPEMHNMSIVLSWLIWSNPSERPGFLVESI